MGKAEPHIIALQFFAPIMALMTTCGQNVISEKEALAGLFAHKAVERFVLSLTCRLKGKELRYYFHRVGLA